MPGEQSRVRNSALRNEIIVLGEKIEDIKKLRENNEERIRCLERAGDKTTPLTEKRIQDLENIAKNHDRELKELTKLINTQAQSIQKLTSSFANMAKDAGFSWVAIKAADGTIHFNQGAGPAWAQPDLLQAAINTLRAVGIKVLGWQYIYGANPLKQSIAAIEAQRAIENIERFDFDGWLIDPEKEYKRSGAAAWADIYMTALRSSCPNVPIGLCSYRFPSLHPEIPWHNFLRRCNFHAPQVYWIGAHNPGDQLRKSVRELQALANLPVVPVGAAYYDPTFKWQPTVAELNELDRTAHELKLPGVTWWGGGENGHGAQYIADFWAATRVPDWGQLVI